MPIDVWWYASRECWCADVPTDDGRKRLYFGESKEEARAQLHRYMAQYYDGLEEVDGDSTSAAAKTTSPSLVELAVRFLKWTKANRAEGTWRAYRDGLKHVIQPYQDRLSEELEAQDIEKIKVDMIEAGYRARTINIMVGTVKRLYNWAVSQSLIDENPIEEVERVSKHVNAPENPPQKHLGIEKAQQCIEMCRESPPLGDMCELMLLTGMRVGEIVRISWDNIDLKEQMIRLARHKTSGHSDRPRTIPLSDRAIKILQKQADSESCLQGVVFRGRSDQQLTVGALHCRLKRLRKKHPELKDFSFHKLRHTCATYLARQKVPERVAQAILGHSSTLMTRYYTATDPDEMVDAVEKLSEGASREE